MREVLIRADDAAILKASSYMADIAPGMFRDKTLGETVGIVGLWSKQNHGNIGGAYIRDDLIPIVANRLMLRMKIRDGLTSFFSGTPDL